jgi:hypothetical protein
LKVVRLPGTTLKVVISVASASSEKEEGQRVESGGEKEEDREFGG